MKIIKNKKEDINTKIIMPDFNSSKSVNESIINDLDERLEKHIKVISISRSSKTYQNFE